MIRLIRTVVILLIVSGQCQAQVFSGTAPSVRWNQINSPLFRLIYPTGADSVANRISSIIQYTAPYTLSTIGSKMKKIDIIVRNEGLISNGYVSLAPFRSEFYLTPPQNLFTLGSVPWPDLLATHEYRHVQQDASFNVGISHIFKILFGQEGQIFANSGAIPDWFYEGDAVYNESNLTRQGRGSLPYFFKDFRSLWATGKKYSWAKLRNGSYMDFVPDKYALGFMMVAYGREKFGNDFWKKVTGDAAAYKPLFYPFQSAIKKYTGEDYSTFRNKALEFFRSQFPDSLPRPTRDYYLNEYHPVFYQGKVVYLSESVKKIPSFYRKSGNNKNKIRTADIMIDNYFQLHGDEIIYASLRPDIRWGNKSYNDIVALNIKSGKQRTILHKTRYFSPALNQSGDKMAVARANGNGTASLLVLETATGKVLMQSGNPAILNYSYPVFYGDSVISCISDKNGKTSLLLKNIRTGKEEFLLPFSSNVTGWPFVQNDTLYFSYSYRKEDRLFAVTLRDKKIWEIILPNKGLGVYQFAACRDSVAFSSFTAQGFRIVTEAKDQLHFIEIPRNKFITITASFGLMEINTANANLYYSVPDTQFNTKKYSLLTHPFNFHSLEPDVNDPEYSLSLLGNNILNTISSDVTYTYNRSDHSKKIGASVNYALWFPVFTLGTDYEFDQRTFFRDTAVYFNSIEPNAGFYIPLNLSKGRSLTGLTFGSNFRFNSTHFQNPFKNRFRPFTYSYLSHYISFANQSRQATAQVLQPTGQSLFLNFKSPVSGASGYQFLGSAQIFLPGISSTHSLNFTLAYSKKDTLNQINFSNPFPFARGYEAVNARQLEGFQVNYQLPLAYPEIGFAQIVYFSRIRGNAFYDYTRMQLFSNHTFSNRNFRSAGIEIFFDTKWWNQAPVSFGVRYSHLFDQDLLINTYNRWEFILPVNIFNK